MSTQMCSERERERERESINDVHLMLIDTNLRGVYLIIPLRERQGVGNSQPIPVDFKVSRFALRELELR